MNMKRRIAMGTVRTSGCALVLFSSLVLLASSALACTPAVFVFRHAEDTNPPYPLIFHLTPTGEFHALFYRIMVPAFADGTTYCKVTTVYAATTEDKPDRSRSATNSFFTARPLAQQEMGGNDPIIALGPFNKDRPEESRLYEYLGNGIKAPSEKQSNYETEVAKRLRAALLATANKNESSAIFWTSQGMHVLGGVVIDKTSNAPDKNFPGLKYSGTPPRNAVYLFAAVGSAPTIATFSDTPLRTHTKGVSDNPEVLAGFYVQCFNHVEYSQDLNPHPAHFVQDPVRFYCGYGGQSNLGGSPPAYSANPPKTCNYDAKGKLTTICDGSIPANQNIKIDGKICNTTALDPNVDNSTDIYGACMP